MIHIIFFALSQTITVRFKSKCLNIKIKIKNNKTEKVIEREDSLTERRKQRICVAASNVCNTIVFIIAHRLRLNIIHMTWTKFINNNANDFIKLAMFQVVSELSQGPAWATCCELLWSPFIILIKTLQYWMNAIQTLMKRMITITISCDHNCRIQQASTYDSTVNWFYTNINL